MNSADRIVSPLEDPAFLVPLRAQMHRFALLQLSDAALADDAVQEALIGALRNAAAFAGRSAFKTWVFAILKHKIADVLRQRQRFVDVSTLLGSAEEDEDFSALFDRKGFWQADDHPADWGDPEAVLRDGQFWKVFELCLDHLPASQGRAFMMREFVGLDSEEICKATGISMTNLYVTLHRARMRLRECLENRWLDQGE
jgi:RNA polymerase sigma-70 factor (TIGR02943 family)